MTSTGPLPLGITIGELLDRWPGTFEVLEEAGVRLDPFTLIALRSTPEELAEYSAMRDPGELRRALEAFIAGQAMAPGINPHQA